MRTQYESEVALSLSPLFEFEKQIQIYFTGSIGLFIFFVLFIAKSSSEHRKAKKGAKIVAYSWKFLDTHLHKTMTVLKCFHTQTNIYNLNTWLVICNVCINFTYLQIYQSLPWGTFSCTNV